MIFCLAEGSFSWTFCHHFVRWIYVGMFSWLSNTLVNYQQPMNLFSDTAAIFNSIVSNNYYVPWASHKAIWNNTIFKMATVLLKGSLLCFCTLSSIQSSIMASTVDERQTQKTPRKRWNLEINSKLWRVTSYSTWCAVSPTK